MEAPAVYTVNYQALPLQAMNVEQLEAQKEAWIYEGFLRFSDLATVIREFGHLVNEHTRWLMLYQDHDLEALYHARAELFLVDKQRFAFTQTVAVWVNGGRAKGDQVCRLTKTEEPGKTPDNLYVPGRWEDRLLKMLPDALEIVRAREAAEQDRKRRDLLRQLLAGKVV
jgi:hypothetical protein